MNHECIQKHTIDRIEETLKESKSISNQIPALIERMDQIFTRLSDKYQEVKDELEYQDLEIKSKCSQDEFDKFSDTKTIMSVIFSVAFIAIVFQAGFAWKEISDLIRFKDILSQKAFAQDIKK